MPESSSKASKKFNFQNSIRFKLQRPKELLHQNLQIRRTLKEHSFKSFFQALEFYWNQAPKPSETLSTLIY